MIRCACSLLVLLLVTGCVTVNTHTGRDLEHVVVVWLKEPGNEDHRRTILLESEVLRSIPGVTALKSGRVVPSGRDIVDSSFDVAMIVTFASEAAMHNYLEHPTHVRLVNETLQPLVAKIRVFDFR